MPPSNSLPNNTLTRARGLDPTALESIHTRYYPEVFRYIRFRLDPESVCEQIASEVFSQLLEALQKKRVSRQGLHRWLLNSAASLVQEMLKYNAAQASANLPGASEPDSGHSGVFNAASERRHLRRLLQQLTSDQQHFLAVRFGERRTLEETAELIGKSLNDAKELQFQAVAAFKHLLVDERA